MTVQEHPPLGWDTQLASGVDRGQDHRRRLVHQVPRYEQAAVTVGTITRWTRIGFEVRLEVTPEDARQPGPVLVSLTRTDATALGLHEGDRVWLRLRPGAS